MNSVELVNKLKRIATSWTRVALVDLIDSEQSLIFTMPVPILRVYNSVTGKDPLLTTVDGQSVYEISSSEGYDADVWKITSIRSGDGNPVAISDEYVDTNSVRVVQSSKGESAKVIFNFNPGAGKTFFLECYKRPLKLESENTEITLPEQFHDAFLYEAVAGRIEKPAHGVSNRYTSYLETLLPSLQQELMNDKSSSPLGTSSSIITSLINSVEKLAPLWERQRFLREINSLQTVVFDYFPELLRITEDGRDPILTTTVGVYEYDLVDSTPAIFGYNVNSVMEIVTTSGTIATIGDEFTESKRIHLRSKLGGTPAQVLFAFDPGADTYSVKCYSPVEPIDTESDELTLPEEYIWSIFIEGLVAKIKMVESGASDDYIKFVSQSLPQFAKHLKSRNKEIHVNGATPVTKFIDSVMKEVGDKYTRHDIIDEINIIQDQIFAIAKTTNRVFSATGGNPELTIVTGQSIYELNEANFGFDIQYIMQVYDLNGDIVENFTTRKAIGPYMAKIILFDEVVIASTYTVECYAKITPVINENSVFSLPVEYIYDYLYEGVVGRLTQYNKGGSQRLRDFNFRLKRTLSWELDKEANSSTLIIEPRGI